MILKISHDFTHLFQDADGVWHQIHAAGIDPNSMSRFLHSNSQEVLFVN
jgi:hypothetical protein